MFTITSKILQITHICTTSTTLDSLLPQKRNQNTKELKSNLYDQLFHLYDFRDKKDKRYKKDLKQPVLQFAFESVFKRVL